MPRASRGSRPIFALLCRWLGVILILAGLACRVFPAFPVAAQNPSSVTVSVKVNDLAYSPLTRLLYASVPGDDPQYANSLTAVNPQNGAVVNSVPAGNNPTRLAISDDGHYLYLIHDQTAINRYDLTTFQSDQSFQSTMKIAGSPLVPSDISVMPGQPDVAAVALVCAECTGAQAIAIYDKGVMRPVVSSDTTGSRVAFSSADTLWAIGIGYTPRQVWQYSVDSTGVTKVGDFPAVYFDDFDRGFQISNGLIYGMVGEIFNPAQSSFDGLFNTDGRQTNAFAIDAASGRAYFLVAEQYETDILAFDLNTYLEVGSYSARSVAGINVITSNVMTLCGPSGIAVAARDAGGIVIFPFSALQAPAPYVKPDPVKLKKPKPRIFPLASNHITYDENRRLIYASVPGAAGNIGNSIVPVDPFKGIVKDPVWVGSEPQAMGMSTDGNWLYTALFGSFSIRRMSVADLTPDQSFRLRTEFNVLNPVSITRAKQIISLPGSPQSVVVNLSPFPGSFDAGTDGVAVYDNGIRRPLSVPGEFFGGIQELQLSEDGTLLYGIDWPEAGTQFVTMAITPDGVQIASQSNVAANSYHLKCQNGFCFTEYGAIIDAKTRALIGQFSMASIGDSITPVQVAPDVTGGVVYFLGAPVFRPNPIVSVFDLNTRKLIASYEVTGATGVPVDFFIWRGDQLAFNTPTQIVLLPARLLKAALP